VMLLFLTTFINRTKSESENKSENVPCKELLLQMKIFLLLLFLTLLFFWDEYYGKNTYWMEEIFNKHRALDFVEHENS
jgi:hypothetical protein